VRSRSATPIDVSDPDCPGVVRAVGDLPADIKRVTGVQPAGFDEKVPPGRDVVIIGTIGHSPLIDNLVAAKKLDASGIEGKRETSLPEVVQNPIPGVRAAFVIACSDQRGTIFGIYDVSRKIGVSPWYWWDDVRIGTAVNTDVLATNAKYRQITADQFWTVAPENVMKWQASRPTQGTYDWSAADQLVNFATANGHLVRGQTLVWQNQLRNWLTTGTYTSAQLRDLLHKHITDEVSHFKGHIWQWDVVNEAFNDDGTMPTRAGCAPWALAISPTRSAGRTRPTRVPCSSTTTTTSKVWARTATLCSRW
jgi:hypothetical protein